MKFNVFLTLRAEFDAEEAYLYVRRSAPRAAIRWFNGLTKAIQSLENNPRRCGLAPESEEFSIEIRQLLYGKRRGIYRILFTIDENNVRILHIRHSARRSWKP